jgi:hypothetical protein
MTKFILFILVLFTGHAFSQSTNPPQFLSPIKANGDVPVILEWHSHAQGLYTVEYSTLLTSNDWKVAEENFPAQGGTTRWTDRGTAAADQFRFSSADQSAPYRFYRVRQTSTSSNAPITVTITNVAAGVTLSNVVTVQGSSSATQGVQSVRVLVDGFPVGRANAGDFSISFDTRLFGNGNHRLTAQAVDSGALESTEESNPVTSRGAAYASTTVAVAFNNFLSAARLKYEAYRPDLALTQEVFALWSTPRLWRVDVTPKGNSNIVHRSYSGGGRRVVVLWNGRNSSNVLMNAQLVDYKIYDLGEDTNSPPSGGGGGPLPMPGASLAQVSSFSTQAPLAIYPPGHPLRVAANELGYVESALPTPSGPASSGTATQDSAETGTIVMAELGGPPAMTLTGPYIFFAKLAVAGQGHHPLAGNYPTPPRTAFGNVRMASRSQFGPWAGLKRVKGLVEEAASTFPQFGYPVVFKKLDDQVKGADLKSSPTNMFNQANIGLYIGHSVAAIDIERNYLYPMSYVPIFNSAANTMEFVRSHDMRFGSTELKWMCFFSCNMFRDGLYRANGIYDGMKANLNVPMNGRLHILQGYASEMSVHPDFIFWWTSALRQQPFVSSGNYTVIAAWNFACRRTQPQGTMSDPANVARSITWPECQGDFILGYGPNTVPNRAPNDPSEQADLLEIDGFPNDPEP